MLFFKKIMKYLVLFCQLTMKSIKSICSVGAVVSVGDGVAKVYGLGLRLVSKMLNLVEFILFRNIYFLCFYSYVMEK